MHLRVARHTTNLQAITDFYTQLLGLEVLGSFNDHDGYDGVFLGTPEQDWHLEFTTSAEPPSHQPDEDDLLVFYVDTQEELEALAQRFSEKGIETVEPKNPYWLTNGIAYADSDGYRVVIAVRKV